MASWKRSMGAWALALSMASCAAATTQPGSGDQKDSGAGPTGSGGSRGGSGGGSGGASTPGGGSGGAAVDASGFDATVGPGPDGPNCGLQTFALDRLPPNVLLVLDKSTSMSQFAAPPTLLCLIMHCPSKWEDMKTALTSTVMSTQATVNWGLSLFPTDMSCGVSGDVAAPVAPNNATALLGAIDGTMPSGNTPTRLAVEAGGKYLMSLTTPNPRYMVLATDGLPNCSGAQGDGDDVPTIAAVKAVAAAGIPVFVIGVGTAGMGDATLSMMAVAGGKPRMGDPSYYPVATAADLSAALAAIGGQFASCTLPIKSPPDPNNIAVDADGARVPRNDTEGWSYGPGMSTILLHGSYCSKLSDGTIKNVKAIFGCPGVIIP